MSDTPRRELASFPERMTMKDIAEWLGVSLSRAYALEAQGDFAFAQHRPMIGRKSWSRQRFAQWDAGTLTGLTVARRRHRTEAA